MRKLKHDVWPHQIILRGGQDEAIARWCWDNCGRRFQDWYGYMTDDNNRLYAFKDTETLLTFKIRWGQYVVRQNI